MGVIVKRVGLFGGTFDPFHLGHLAVIESVLDTSFVEEIWAVPAKLPRLRETPPVASVKHRMDMLNLGTEGLPNVSCLTIEMDRSGVTNTVDTLRQLHELHGSIVAYSLVVGQDIVPNFNKWIEYEEIVELADVIVVGRPQAEHADLRAGSKGNSFTRITYVQGQMVNINASNIRSRLRAGMPIDDVVPAKVAAYIKQHNLYIQLCSDATDS